MQHLNHSLQPACNFLMYAGSRNAEHVKATQEKHGKLFMVLVVVGCLDLILPTGLAFHIPSSHILKLTTWLGFLHHWMRARDPYLGIMRTCPGNHATSLQRYLSQYPSH